MKKLNSKGFTPLQLLLMVVIVGSIGAAGYYVYKSQQAKKSTIDTAVNSASNPQKTETEQEESQHQSDLKEYSNSELGFKFLLPKDWTVNVQSPGTCPALVSSFQSSGTSDTKCPIQGSIYVGAPGDSTYLANILVFTGATNTLDEVLAIEGGPNATKSEKFITSGKLNAFFYNQGLDKTSNAYSDNVYVIEYSPRSYLYLNSREYTPTGVNAADLRQYQPQFDAVAHSVSKL